jgi:F-type H+-transporting ATPase subunit gamma
VEESIQHNVKKKVLVVAITSNRGLCAFNSNVIKASKSRSVFYAGKQVDVAIGKKGNDVLVKTSVVIDNQSAVYDDLTLTM